METINTIDEGRCTSVALRALGVALTETVVDGWHAMETMRAAGLKLGIFGVRGFECFDADSRWISGKATVREFVKAHPTGRYYLGTRGHGMALVDGVLHDAAERGADGRRLIQVVQVGE